jgi:phospholipase C
MIAPDRRNGLDHVVVLMFENRSFDNLLGRL